MPITPIMQLFDDSGAPMLRGTSNIQGKVNWLEITAYSFAKATRMGKPDPAPQSPLFLHWETPQLFSRGALIRVPRLSQRLARRHRRVWR
jgi:hypothetical protein